MLKALWACLLISVTLATKAPKFRSAKDVYKQVLQSPNQGLCNQTLTLKKIASTQANIPVCSAMVGDLRYLCGNYTFQDANDACLSYGWRLAMITPDNKNDAIDLVQSCMTTQDARAWVAGNNGVPGDPCAYILNYNDYVGVVFNIGTQLCSAALFGAVCQEIPAKTYTSTTTVGETIVFGDPTTTTVLSVATRTIHPYHPHCPSSSSSSSSSECRWDTSSSSWTDCGCDSSSSSSSSDCGCWHNPNGKNALKAKSFAPKIEVAKEGDDQCMLGNCAPVCRYHSGDIRIIQKNVTYDQAAAECAKYGWTLMDFTNGRQAALASVFSRCQPAGIQGGFLNSFNGVTDQCVIVEYVDAPGIVLPIAAIGVPLNEQWCTIDAEFFPVCQKNPPYQLGVADDPGLVSATLIQSTVVVPTLTLPTSVIQATVTCTETVYVDDHHHKKLK